MSYRSISEQIDLLLSRRVAETKVRGSPSPDAEAKAVFETLVLNLLSKPKSVYYLAILAKNGLQNAISNEIDSIDALKQIISDLSNPTYSLERTNYLEQARSYLIQLGGMDKISASSSPFKMFDKSINNYLEKIVSKNVRRKGSSEFIRSGSEASIDLGTELDNLKGLHSDFLDRLYSIIVGVDNFFSSPLSTLLGMATVSRARLDIEDILDSIYADDIIARDVVTRLIGSRSAIRYLGTLPDPTDPVLDTDLQLPIGHVLRGVSPLTKAYVYSSAVPHVLPASSQISIDVNGVSAGPFNFPQTTFDLNNKASIVSSDITYPVTIPSDHFLFVSLESGGSTLAYKLPIPAGSKTFAQLLQDIQTAISDAGLTAQLGIDEYIKPGTSRLILYAKTASKLTVASYFFDVNRFSPDTYYVTGYYIKSVHEFIGFEAKSVESGSTPLFMEVDALNYMFNSLILASNQIDNFKIETLVDSIGTYITITAPTALGIAGTTKAVSSYLRLVGTIFTKDIDPANPSTLLDIGDSITSPTGDAEITALSDTTITLSSELPTFDGSITVTSSLIPVYQALSTTVNAFLQTWLNTEFSSNLTKIDLAIASLKETVQEAQKRKAISLLDKLRSELSSIYSSLSTITLPNTTATREKVVINGIIASLTERRYDRALQMFMKAQIAETIKLTSITASFSGSLMKSVSDIARTDVRFPDIEDGEGEDATAIQDRVVP